MLNLLRNELFKIFHKKSTFIVLIVIFLFVVLTNVIYRYMNYSFYESSYYYESKEDVKAYLDSYNSSRDNIYDYIYYLALNDAYTLLGDLDNNTWQYEIVMKDYYDAVYQYYENKYINNIEDNDLVLKIQKIKDCINNGDWQFFIKEKITEVTSEIKNLKYVKEKSELSSKEIKELDKQIYALNENLYLLNYRLEENVLYNSGYLNDAIKTMEEQIYGMAEYKYGDEKTKEEYEQTIKSYYENKYILEEKVDTNNVQTIRTIFINFFSEYGFLIFVFVVMIAGAIVSDEFNKGTIKSLLTLPYNRTKILLAKYIAVLLMILFGISFVVLAECIVGGIVFGYSSLSVPFVTYNLASNSLEIMHVFKYLLLTIVTNLPQIILLGTLAFAISTLLNNTAFAITITFFGMIASEIINSLAYNYKIKFLNYFVTTNWDFSTYLFGGSSIYGNSLTQSIIVCFAYLFIMLIVAFIVFRKKDIKNI